MRLLFSFAMFVCFLLPAQTPAQPQAESPGDEFMISMDVSRVVLYATVHDRKAGLVGDLQREHFTVREDGKPQEIRDFRREDVPVAVGLVIDNSQSMMNKRDQVVEAAFAFVKKRNPQDEMFVIHFSDEIKFGLPKDKMFTSDPAELRTALEQAGTVGKTALYDAVHVALRHLGRSKLTKKALLVISDGGDNMSQKKLDDVVREADLSGALFYGVGIYDPMDGDANPAVLKEMAKRTGGESFFPRDVQEVTTLCELIARDLRNQYMLVYAPESRQGDKEYHKVQVSVRDPLKRRLTIRTRTGYYGDAGQKTKEVKP